MSSKSVHRLVRSAHRFWVGDGWLVDNVMNSYDAGIFMSPFIHLDYAPATKYEPTDRLRGIGLHPHRGLDTVTIALQGGVRHEDACGSSGSISAGDIQWMRAGRGIEHQETHSEEFAKHGGVMEMIQLWINLPKKDKFTEPGYQAITKDQIPRLEVPGGTMDVICGQYSGTKGPAHAITPLDILKLSLQGPTTLSLREGWVTGVFLFKGSASINGQDAAHKEIVLLNREGTEVTIDPNGEAGVLVLSGKPLDEPIAARGPMVMNTKEEIDAAFKDYKKGLFRENSTDADLSGA